jgi:hypothetical protein
MTDETNISSLSADNLQTPTVVASKEDIQKRKYLLINKTIGISISESDDLTTLGYDVIHLKDAMIEVARYILAMGGRIAYGGDMRQGGFTELFFDLLAYYKADESLHPNERFFSYLAWPLSLNLTSSQQANLIENVSFKKVAPPRDVEIDNPSEFLKPDSPDNLYIWSRSLTEMRTVMEGECDARIFIGGRNKEFKGKMPGILEELMIALNCKHPVYLIGAFGGITKDIIEALENKQANSFSKEYYLENDGYKSFYELYNARNSGSPIDFNTYFSYLKDLGFEGLSELNGLSEEENRRLTVTPHLPEIIYLILKGLTKKFGK